MIANDQARARSEMLKRLRQEHETTVEKTQILLKEQKRIQQEICKVIREKPAIVPEIARATGIPAHQVLWHVQAMKKYGIVLEMGMCGDYPLYRRVEGK